MKLFLKYAGEHLRNFPQVKLTRQDEIEIRNSVMESLGLENMNHLRDRYEGQSFLDKTIRNYGGLIVCQKYLDLQVTPSHQVDLKGFQPTLTVGKKVFNIHIFSFGDLPLLNSKETNCPTIFVIQKDKLSFMIGGYAEPSLIKQHLIEPTEVTSSPKKMKNFIGFGELKHIDNLKKSEQ